MDQQLWRKRWRRAIWVSSLLRSLPFIRMIGLNGSMVTGQMYEGSDIDFFVVVKHGHLFTGRLLVIGLVRLLGVGTTRYSVANRICLNRFSSDRFLDITPHNKYHATVFHNLIPLVSLDYCYEQYCAVNRWMKELDEEIVVHQPIFVEAGPARFFRSVAEWILDCFGARLEKQLKFLQEQKVIANQRLQETGSQVVFSDYEVRYHFTK